MLSKTSVFLILTDLLLIHGASARTTDEWRSRSIYQIVTDRFARTDGSTTAPCDTSQKMYCGGTWQGIVDHLDYIQGMGFTAIWISPVTEQIDGSADGGEAYHGYYQRNLYGVNGHFGTPDDLRKLQQELDGRGMYLMVDVVANHFGYRGPSQDVDYSVYNPFDSADDFHSPCSITGDLGSGENATNVEECWLYTSQTGGIVLPDTRTEDPGVASQFQSWISSLVSNYSIDGLRLDTVPYVDLDFWKGFQQASGVFSTGEVFQGDFNYFCPFQKTLDSLLNYPIFFPLRRAFSPGATRENITELADEVNGVKNTCADSTVLGTFLDNHDNPRFAHAVSDKALQRNALAFTLLADGIPIVYQGDEQGLTGGSDPANREAIWLQGYDTTRPMYKFVAQLNQIRGAVVRAAGADTDEYLTYKNFPVYTDDTTIAMRKGNARPLVTVLTNLGSGGAEYTFNLTGNLGFAAGSQVLDVVGCDTATVNGDGSLPVRMGQGQPKVFYPADALGGSGVCGRGGGGAAGRGDSSMRNDVKSNGVDGDRSCRKRRVAEACGLAAAIVLARSL